MAERLENSSTCYRASLSSSLALTTSWICFRVVSPEFISATKVVNSQQVCLRPVGILINPVMFDLNYLFQPFAWPHQPLRFNTAEGK